MKELQTSLSDLFDLFNLFEKLRKQKARMAFAESCTGGLLSSWVTAQPGVSDLFLGSVVSYSNDAKLQILGVHRETLDTEGAVSETTALQMAQGVRKLLKSEYSIAITGIAGPSGGSPAKPVGTVCFAVCGTQFDQGLATTKLFSGDRVCIQEQAALFGIQFLSQKM